MTTQFEQMTDDAKQDVINAVTEQAAASDDAETTAKLLSAANQLIETSAAE